MTPALSHSAGSHHCAITTAEQNLDLQSDALSAFGCERIFTDTASASTTTRPALTELLELLLPGDMLAVWRLDRLGRNLPHLIEHIADLKARGGLAAARERGKVGGRPPALTVTKKREATRIYNQGNIIGDIADALRVSKCTLYRHFQKIGR